MTPSFEQKSSMLFYCKRSPTGRRQQPEALSSASSNLAVCIVVQIERFYMRVKDLMKLLETLPKNAEVLVSSDSEGNHYSPLGHIDTDMGDMNTLTDATFYSDDVLTEEVVDSEEREYIEDLVRCIAIYPTR
jgi:hypothetical protein